jgi:predicted metallopeptidase
MDGNPERPARVPTAGCNFNACIRQVCADMVARLPELDHIDFDRVAVSVTQARNGSGYGTHATLTPMRFRGGSPWTSIGGRRFTVERLHTPSGVEALYILTFYLPRFMDGEWMDKLTTIVHELWHISPDFDGDIRRHAGRYYAHGRSREDYDAAMMALARRWLAREPPAALWKFLQNDFHQLQARYGSVRGLQIPHPKLVPCPA